MCTRDGRPLAALVIALDGLAAQDVTAQPGVARHSDLRALQLAAQRLHVELARRAEAIAADGSPGSLAA